MNWTTPTFGDVQECYMRKSYFFVADGGLRLTFEPQARSLAGVHKLMEGFFWM